MIQITPQMRILVYVQPVDFRKGIDGLCRISREAFRCDPFSGALFVFCNKRRTALRILAYDGQGFWLCHKRLSRGRFRWIGKVGSPHTTSLAAVELQMLLWNGDLSRVDVPAPWREISPEAPGFHGH
jgi:transposase